MEFNMGDKIIYEDLNFNCFKGEIVDIWKNDKEEISAFFIQTETGLHIHMKPGSLEWCRLDKPVSVS